MRILTVLFSLLSFVALSQKETSQWHFGRYVSFDFSTSPPTQSTSSINTNEGCASIADANSNLLFYTDGATIWDKTHNVMSNGSGLLGNGPSYTFQAAIIIKKPGSAALYYVFTLDDAGGPNGLMYSTVDMTQAGGLGAVTVKNVPLHTPSSEKMTAVNHCNGTDVWLISHDLNSGDFRSFLVTSSGVSSTPVISPFPNLSPIYSSGTMKASPNGKKIILAAWTNPNGTTKGGFELYDFDNVTGTVTNQQVLFATHSAWGCEFSPDSKKVYGTYNEFQAIPTPIYHGILIQWDMCTSSNTAIVATQNTLTGQITKLTPQLAPDGKIYIANNGQVYNSVSIINSPNNLGAACNFSDAVMAITSGTIATGLPNFNSSFFYTPHKGGFQSQVSSGTVCMLYDFQVSDCESDISDVVSAKWSFGDPITGALNTSTVINPSHQFSAPGNYTVTVIKNYNCTSDTIQKVIQVAATVPSLTIAGNKNICVGNTTTLSVSGANSYSWIAGQNSSSIVVSPTTSAIYTVTGTYTATGCSSTSTVQVNTSPCLTIDENGYYLPVTVYPNPANDFITVSVSQPSSVELYDVMGRKLFHSENFTVRIKIDIQGINDGMILVKVATVSGRQQLFRVIKN